MSTSNSQNVTLTASTASALTWAEWFETIVITNLGSTAVWVATDGSAATVGGTGDDVVLPGQVATFANRQPKPACYTPEQNMAASTGATSQQAQNGTDLPASGFGTYVSLISSGTPELVVSPQ